MTCQVLYLYFEFSFIKCPGLEMSRVKSRLYNIGLILLFNIFYISFSLPPNFLTSISMFSICPQFISHDIDRENLFDNQEHLRLAILTLISMFESAVTLCVEISHLALSNRGGLRCFLFKVLLIECNLIENKLPGFCMQGVWNLFISFEFTGSASRKESNLQPPGCFIRSSKLCWW